MVEIVLIQRFLLYFGNPIHAAAAVISGILVCSGIGSLLSVHWIRKKRACANPFYLDYPLHSCLCSALDAGPVVNHDPTAVR